MSTEPDPLRVAFREKEPPYNISYIQGFLPFEVFGEKFAVTYLRRVEDNVYRATHVETGVGIPNTHCNDMRAVPAITRNILAQVGEAKFREGLKSIRARIESAAKDTA